MEERNKKILCIRKENKNKWERRVALVPDDCKILINRGITIKVQPSSLRCFTDKQYEEAGCEITEDFQDADLILGVKEVPLEFIKPNLTYMYFSHTLKGQPSNMPALKDLLNKKVRLIDYELIKETTGTHPQRLVAFGRFAGLAGGVDFLQGIGEFLLYKNIHTPFIHAGYSYMFPSVEEAKVSIKKVGDSISKRLLPEEICPFIIGVTSSGRVSHGVQEILKLIPHEYLEPDNLQSAFENPKRNIIYITVIESKHMYINKKTQTFNKEDFYQNPQEYESVFAEKYLPHLSVLYHCMFWAKNQPKVITLEEAQNLCVEKKMRLMGISDITCDMDGSIELLQKYTTIENPFYTIDPITNFIEEDFTKASENSILYHAVDHLPAEFPFDASKHFSEKLFPFIEGMLESTYPSSMPDLQYDSLESETKRLPAEILNACETWNGKLMPQYEYLYTELIKYYPEFKNQAENATRRKSV